MQHIPETNDEATLDQWIGPVAELLARHIESAAAGTQPVNNVTPLTDNLEWMQPARWIRQGGLHGEALLAFLHNYLCHSVRLQHPAYLAHQVASPLPPSAVADLIHGAINNPGAMYEMGPAAATLEFATINWMLEKIGWTPEPAETQPTDDAQHAAGVLTSGGSLANLTALLAARSVVAPDAWLQGNPTDLAVLAPATSHYSVARSLSIMGLGQRALVTVRSDAQDRIDLDDLRVQTAQCTAQGRRIMAVVCNACITSTGLFDDLPAIAAHCQAHNLWLHVDACHGGSLLLSAKHKHRLQGIDLADSVVWDAHKMLDVSGLCAAVLVKHADHLRHAFQQQASYLFYGHDNLGIDYIHRSVECTKTAMGTKLFLTLAWRGEAWLGRGIERRVDLARRAHDWLVTQADFSCPCVPESNILCFRYSGGADAQINIRSLLLHKGLYHLSSSEVNGQRHLRLVVMSQHTRMRHIKALAQAIRACAQELESNDAADD